MQTRCPLCTRDVPSDDQTWCECGWAMDAGCYDAHDDWCGAHGRDAWIGALER